MRKLASFSDAIITRVRRSASGREWYASLDVGPQRYVADPDFTACAQTPEWARQQCAAAIRANEARIRSDLYRFSRYWSFKERYDGCELVLCRLRIGIRKAVREDNYAFEFEGSTYYYVPWNPPDTNTTTFGWDVARGDILGLFTLEDRTALQLLGVKCIQTERWP
jgi:hypothetical protein